MHSSDFWKAKVSDRQSARKYVVHGTESGGAIRETFAGPEPLEQLHPVDSIGANGVHEVVVGSD
jgi:hypothetical protein